MKNQKTLNQAWLERRKTCYLLLALIGTILLGQGLLSQNKHAQAVYTMDDLAQRVTIETSLDKDDLYEVVRDYYTASYVQKAQELYPGLSQIAALERAMGMQQGSIGGMYGSENLQSVLSDIAADKKFMTNATIDAQDQMTLRFVNKIINEVGTQKVEKEQSLNAKKMEILDWKQKVAEKFDAVSQQLPSLIPK
ncbi:MAG: hypothetical protein PHU71_00045 [Candidatus Gracilibacteria bacterium]|nr:hypothetical protein [Candidatus Gracilibacteria bacterium]